MYSYLRSSAGSTPQLYGLLKVHKQDVPLCPIVSFVSSLTYRLSRFLANLLTPVVGQSSSHVRNARDFAEFISRVCHYISVQKPTHTNQYLPFDLHHPVAHKASVVRKLMSRASELSSNGMVRVAEEERVVDALKQSG